MSGNTDRRTNFCKDESNKLMLLLKEFPVIVCKKTDHTSNKQKDAAWKLLADKFNADATSYRSLKQLQQKYNNLKKTARKRLRDYKQTPKPTRFSYHELILFAAGTYHLKIAWSYCWEHLRENGTYEIEVYRHPHHINIGDLGLLILTGMLWGCTNPFIRQGTKGLRDVNATTYLGQAWAEISFLLGNWKYVLPWLVNQVGSLVYLVAVRRTPLSVAVPTANSLAFAFTAVTDVVIGTGERLDRWSIMGIILIMAGTALCCYDQIS